MTNFHAAKHRIASHEASHSTNSLMVLYLCYACASKHERLDREALIQICEPVRWTDMLYARCQLKESFESSLFVY